MNATIAAENFARWDAALQAGDPAKVAALYGEGFTLLPTLAATTITDKAGAMKYFTFFGGFHPTVTMVEEHVIPVSDQSFLHCGVYRFVLDTPIGREPVDARFSLLWKKNGNRWEILHHHSSRVPLATTA